MREDKVLLKLEEIAENLKFNKEVEHHGGDSIVMFWLIKEMREVINEIKSIESKIDNLIDNRWKIADFIKELNKLEEKRVILIAQKDKLLEMIGRTEEIEQLEIK
ncbi:hypothetical protein QYB63_001220 [Clostridium perfringens]|nr:hypothetical protein [Clostridium perfringens]